MPRKFINKFAEQFQLNLEKDTRNSFIESLALESSKFLPLAGILALVAWLPFISLDSKLYPDLPLLPLRLGLTISGIIVLLVTVFWDKEKRDKYGIRLLMIPLLYIQIATPLITGLTDSNPFYVSGLSIVIMIMPVVPVPLSYSIKILGLSAAIYSIFIFTHGVYDTRFLYIIQNLSAAYIASAVFSLLTNRIRMEKFHKERDIEDNLEQVQRLLENVLPKEVAIELQMFGSAEPIKYQSATVMFTDFEGFTKQTKDLSPDQLLEELDSAFSYFDLVTGQYHLEKLKTIGDSYMCVGGIPTPNLTHSVDSILAAIEMRDFIHQAQEIKARLGVDFWGIRIGIHTGPLVAGVIGKKKFAYDVWGDTVNMASRMEEHGLSGQINISATTWHTAKNFFECVSRGKVNMKHIGMVEMFSVKGLRPELSERGEGRVPNAHFYEKYENLKNVEI